MTKSALSLLTLASALALSACVNAEDSDGGPGAAAGEDGKPPLEVLSIDALDENEWNLATLGRREKRGYLSKGSSVDVEDLWLIERSTGATFDLVPEGLGPVTRSYFLSGETGPLQSFSSYNSNPVHSDEQPLTHYLFMVSAGKKQTSLYAGSLTEKQTTKLGGPYASILHLEMLTESQLAIYAESEGAVQRVVFDLQTMAQIAEAEVKPQTNR